MKFEVRYPSGVQHDVILDGTLAVVGRDPSCDVVLNDVKCSRRHAVVEAGQHGLTIRDTGSANGVYVNGRKVERAGLVPGDLIRLGEVILRVMEEEIEGTVVMGPDDMEGVDIETAEEEARPPEASETSESPPAAQVPPPPPSPPAPAQSTPIPLPPPVPHPPAAAPRAARPATPPPPLATRARPAAPVATPRLLRGPLARPLTLTVLAGLWALSVLLYAGGGVALGFTAGLPKGPAAAGLAAGLFMAALSAAMAYGVWIRAPWARVVQIVLAGAGVLNCPFTLASVTVLFYLLRPEGSLHFSGRALEELGEEERTLVLDDSAEGAFAGTLIGTVLVGTVAAGALVALAIPRLEL